MKHPIVTVIYEGGKDEKDTAARVKIKFGPNDERRFESVAPFSTKARAEDFRDWLQQKLNAVDLSS